MSYIDKSLGAGETVIARAHFPWIYNLAAWCQLLIPALVLAGLLAWASRQPNFLATNSPLTWAAALVAIWLILGLIVLPAHDDPQMDHRDRRHQPSLCGEIWPAVDAHQ